MELTPTMRRLHETIAAKAPIHGVRRGNPPIDFKPEATEQQRADAMAALNAFDWSPGADAAWIAARQPDKKALADATTQAFIDIDAYLAIGTPTAPQTTAMVKRMATLLRLLLLRVNQIP